MATTDMREFFTELYGTDAPGYLICVAKVTDGMYSTAVPAVDIDACVEALHRPNFTVTDVWFNVGLQPTVPRRRGGAKTVLAIPGVWCDIDIEGKVNKKRPETIEACIQIVRAMPVQPNVIVNTGHGVHCHWLFDRLAHVANCEVKLSALTVAWGRYVSTFAWLGYDDIDKVGDLARMLRPPGTTNCKTEQHLPVVIHSVRLVVPIPAYDAGGADPRGVLVEEARGEGVD